MVTEDQTAVIDFLASPSAHGGASVERIDTHSAIVFLAGARAWKLKRAVRFDYLDFSNAERRRAMCEAEVRLNRRTAPSIYRGVAPVTRASDGTLAVNGTGTAVDWLVEMHRFDQECLLDRLAGRNRLEVASMPALGAAVARFHATAQARREYGGRAGMAWVIDGNAEGLLEFGAGILDPAACRGLSESARAVLFRHGPLLDERRDAGYVRQCHGDLHLRNIVMLDGQPAIFDAIEFNDQIACVDVLYDLAFLLMDLWRRRLPRHANVLWNSYLSATDDWDGLSLLPLFLSCRAAVRAKTSATAAGMQASPDNVREFSRAAQEYLALAERLLQPPPPCLVAIGGFSGTGKSTLALGMAPHVGGAPGAIVLRSDEIRKHLAGVSPLEHLGPERYTAPASDQVYATAARRAGTAVRAGRSVVVDAVCANPEDRVRLERVATDASVPFVGLWLDAPAPHIIDRVQRRGADVSDATTDIVRMQLATGTGAIAWRRIDASASADAVLREAMGCLPAVAQGDTR